METSWDGLDAIIKTIGSAVISMFQRLFSDPNYRDGFVACFLTIFVVGGLSRLISWAWGLVQKFFSATKAPPAPGAGPTPAGLMGGCVQGAFILLLFAVVVVFLLLRSVLP